MSERGLSFKDAVNSAIRAGLAQPRDPRARYTQPRALGHARTDLTHAIETAGRLEGEELVRRFTEGR